MKTAIKRTLTEQARDIANEGLNGWGNTMMDAVEAITSLEADNATLADENCQLRTQEISYQTQIAAMREALSTIHSDCVPDDKDGTLTWEEAASRSLLGVRITSQRALTPDSGKVLVDVEKLRALEWVGVQGSISDFCPACSGFEPRSGWGMDTGQTADCWLDAILNTHTKTG